LIFIPFGTVPFAFFNPNKRLNIEDPSSTFPPHIRFHPDELTDQRLAPNPSYLAALISASAIVVFRYETHTAVIHARHSALDLQGFELLGGEYVVFGI
jgi:hypothetical protein